MTRYYPVALALEGQTVLVVGGMGEAEEKARRLLGAGARVSVVAERVSPGLAALAARGALRWSVRGFCADDVRGARVVVLAERDATLAAAVRRAARVQGAWMVAIDQPEHSDFVHVAAADVGPIGIAVTTHGRAPALAARVRDALRDGLDARFARFADAVVAERAATSGDERRERMKAMLDGLELRVEATFPAWYRGEDAS